MGNAKAGADLTLKQNQNQSLTARGIVYGPENQFHKIRHGFNNQLSPVEFEKRYAMSLQGV